MVLGLPNKAIILGLLGLALLIPSRVTSASAAVQAAGSGFSSALSSIASPRIAPVFNPTIGMQGNIGSRLVDRFFDDPTGDPIDDKYQVGGGDWKWIQPGEGEEPEYVEGPFGPGLKTGGPSAWELITSEDYDSEL